MIPQKVRRKEEAPLSLFLPDLFERETHHAADNAEGGGGAITSTGALQQEEMIDIPDEFYCSITHQIMVDPVVAEDGYSYGG